jgi:glycopeptide antibiotics resistance protein
MTAKKYSTAHIAVFVLFLLYITAILFLLVIPNSFRGHNVLVGGLTWEIWVPHVLRNINLVPFKGIAQQIGCIFAGENTARIIIYLAGNLVGFAPLGFFLPALFAKERKFAAYLITVLIMITVLELMQLVTMRGSFDIDDIILNAAGACIGFLVLRKVTKRIREDGSK